MTVAAIAVYNWPKSWPDLLPFLLKLIGDQTSMNGGVEKERGCNSTRQVTKIPFNNFLYCWNKS
ncbi:hypothetical protein V6Z11_A03G097700 [Gossypium hirsutum]|nr:hypothetical protein ES332_A03G096400v1 [Gossypium tomentosum]